MFFFALFYFVIVVVIGCFLPSVSTVSVCTIPSTTPIVYGISKHKIRATNGNKEREYRIYVPRSYNGTAPVPLILYFPGWTNSCDNFDGGCRDKMCDFQRYAEAYGFIFVSACGYGNSWNAGTCCPPANSVDNNIDDTEYTLSIIQRLKKRYCTDERRIYATGYSNGAMMAQKLGCERPDIFRGIATVAGVTVLKDTSSTSEQQSSSFQLCTRFYKQRINSTSTVNAISILDIHGKEDAYVPLEGNLFLGFPSVYENMQSWKNRIGCTGRTLTTTWSKYPYTSQEYTPCTNDSIIELVIHNKGDHSWYENNPYMNATEYIVNFFERSAYRQYGIPPLTKFFSSSSSSSTTTVPTETFTTNTLKDSTSSDNDVDTIIDVSEMAKRRKRRQAKSGSTDSSSSSSQMKKTVKEPPIVSEEEEEDSKEDLLKDLSNLINSLSMLSDDSTMNSFAGFSDSVSTQQSLSLERKRSHSGATSSVVGRKEKEKDTSNLRNGFEGLAELNGLMNSLGIDNDDNTNKDSASSFMDGNGLDSLSGLMESLQQLGDATTGGGISSSSKNDDNSNYKGTKNKPRTKTTRTALNSDISRSGNSMNDGDVSLEELENLMKTFASFGETTTSDNNNEDTTVPKRNRKPSSKSSSSSSPESIKKNQKNVKPTILNDEDDNLPFEAFEL